MLLFPLPTPHQRLCAQESLSDSKYNPESTQTIIFQTDIMVPKFLDSSKFYMGSISGVTYCSLTPSPKQPNGSSHRLYLVPPEKQFIYEHLPYPCCAESIMLYLSFLNAPRVCHSPLIMLHLSALAELRIHVHCDLNILADP